MDWVYGSRLFGSSEPEVRVVGGQAKEEAATRRRRRRHQRRRGVIGRRIAAGVLGRQRNGLCS